ncbi:NADPH-dependent F420 reductase [Halobacteriales archaeon SW_7_68_16]|nr:MAG: NADPH-dependent F420 reductase [Halobacteriales archaeon SW_7_68_16]
MDIAILGGTGAFGGGLALRWGSDTGHRVVVGSREADRAREAADEYEATLAEAGVDRPIGAGTNTEATADADVVVLAVPPYHVSDTIETVADALAPGTIVVSPAVGIRRDDRGWHYHEPSVGSVAEVAARAVPDDCPVVGALHTLPAGRLADLSATLDLDTVVVGDDPDARETIAALADGIEGVRALSGGPAVNAAEIEAVTPLLVNLARENDGLGDLGVRFQ